VCSLEPDRPDDGPYDVYGLFDPAAAYDPDATYDGYERIDTRPRVRSTAAAYPSR
jgi:hypothetical protein